MNAGFPALKQEIPDYSIFYETDETWDLELPSTGFSAPEEGSMHTDTSLPLDLEVDDHEDFDELVERMLQKMSEEKVIVRSTYTTATGTLNLHILPASRSVQIVIYQDNDPISYEATAEKPALIAWNSTQNIENFNLLEKVAKTHKCSFQWIGKIPEGPVISDTPILLIK